MTYSSWPLSPQSSVCEEAHRDETGSQGPFELAPSARHVTENLEVGSNGS